MGSPDKARRLGLSLFFRAVLGIERIFHFETLTDLGAAILTGGRKVVSRSRLGGWVRAVTTPAMKAFTRATERIGALRDKVVTLSLDEHAVARFTRKFRLSKGFHTIRNKWMRVEKLFFLHWPAERRFLRVVVTKGKTSLAAMVPSFVRAVRARVHPRQLRLVLDAGASNQHAALCGFDRFRKTVFVIRAPRRPAYMRAWKKLPRDSFVQVEEPGRYVGAKAKEIAVTETTTRIKGLPSPVRTIVVREHAMRGKDRWHALFVLHDATTPPLDLVHEFRTRQHHEQGYRIGVHDLALDAVPSGYPKRSSPNRPGFRQGPITFSAWVAALAWEALRVLGLALPRAFHRAHPRTLRRWVLERDAELFVTRSHLLVVLDSTRGQRWLRPQIRAFNATAPALPWLGGRRVVIGFATDLRGRDGRPIVTGGPETGSEPPRRRGSVWC